MTGHRLGTDIAIVAGGAAGIAAALEASAAGAGAVVLEQAPA
jgi:succinate dehydrogenase/fumarate reductase flavoprotein subunit